MTIEEIKQSVLTIQEAHPYTKLLVISGGEPFDQKNLGPLIEEIFPYFEHVTVETSVPKGIERWLTEETRITTNNLSLTLSPKLFLPDYQDFVDRAIRAAKFYPSEFKLVIDTSAHMKRLQYAARKLYGLMKYWEQVYNVPMLDDRTLDVFVMMENSYLERIQAFGNVESYLQEIFALFREVPIKISPRLHNQLKIV